MKFELLTFYPRFYLSAHLPPSHKILSKHQRFIHKQELDGLFVGKSSMFVYILKLYINYRDREIEGWHVLGIFEDWFYIAQGTRLVYLLFSQAFNLMAFSTSRCPISQLSHLRNFNIKYYKYQQFTKERTCLKAYLHNSLKQYNKETQLVTFAW